MPLGERGLVTTLSSRVIGVAPDDEFKIELILFAFSIALGSDGHLFVSSQSLGAPISPDRSDHGPF